LSSDKNIDHVFLFNIKALKEHEEIRPDYLEELKNQILWDGILKMPIAVDKKTYVILDGHHRLQALKRLGYTKIPVILIDYHSPNIKVLAQREGEMVTKDLVIQAALAGKRMPPKTSRHMLMVNGEWKHISCIEMVINIPLEKLK
jgi:ParB-like chromosome segregation protein Spo0J